jgi:hypothetical protein
MTEAPVGASTGPRARYPMMAFPASSLGIRWASGTADGLSGARTDSTRSARLQGMSFQFRDLRAEAATDTDDLAHTQRLLGHKKRGTPDSYTRERHRKTVKPIRRAARKPESIIGE